MDSFQHFSLGSTRMNKTINEKSDSTENGIPTLVKDELY
jgi:hypothetical protein